MDGEDEVRPTFGQLSTWRSIEHLPPERATTANLITTWELPAGATVDAVRAGLARLEERHEALRTRFLRAGPRGVEQHVGPADRGGRPTVELDPHADGGTAGAVAAVAAGLAAEAFDLPRERPWRAAIGTHQGAATHVALVAHHLAVDATGMDVMRRELLATLAGDPPSTPAPSCRALAREQHTSPLWASRTTASVSHWAKALATIAAPPATDGAGTVRWAHLRSRPALVAARRIAEATAASVHSTSLAAYCRLLADRDGSDGVLVGVMAGNRTDDRTRALVSTLNQLVPVAVTVDPAEPFDELVRRVHWAGVRAYRRACYDVDAIADIEAAYGFNAVGGGLRYVFNYMANAAATAAPPGEDEVPGGEGWSIDTRTTGRDSGFPVYLRGGEAAVLGFTLRERSEDPDPSGTRDFLLAFQHLLVDEAARVPGAGAA